jgi:hypothetical protein
MSNVTIPVTIGLTPEQFEYFELHGATLVPTKPFHAANAFVKENAPKLYNAIKVDLQYDCIDFGDSFKYWKLL